MKKKVKVEVSARHIHLSRSDFEFLFGKDGQFENLRQLSQLREFATDKEVKIVGPKGSVSARFLSPFRKKTQVELSRTDCFEIGISAPYEIEIADGGAVVGLSTEIGEIERRAAIIAKRHLHAGPKDAREFGVKAGQQIAVEVKTDRGKILFDNVTVKVASNYQLRVHLDTDEGNAAGIDGKTTGELIINNDETRIKNDPNK